jgi:diguanylate cyclase (GGDEF)-like protein
MASKKDTQPTVTPRDEVIVNWLHRGYVVALTVIIILTLISHNITSKVIEQEIVGAEVASNLSSQITLISQIGRYSASFYISPEDLDLTLLGNAINNMKSSLVHIGAYIDSGGDENSAKTDLRKAMRDSLLLESRLQNFITLAENYLVLAKRPASVDPTEAAKETLEIQRALKKISEKPNQELIKLLQISLADHQENQLSEIRNLHEMQTFLTYGIVFIILMEAMFIFRPLVSKVQRSQRNLMKLALEDTLTGLKNRRAFTKDFDAYELSLQRKKEKFVLAICDLDKFKSVNDTYGHDVGDLVLKHFASILKRALRPTDIVARMGGEEFAILLTNTNETVAFKVLDRLRQIVEKTPCPIKGKSNPEKLSYTTSIGFSEGPIDGVTINIDEFMKTADKALYKAKAEGRNIVVNGRGIE